MNKKKENNIANYLVNNAKKFPGKRAVVCVNGHDSQKNIAYVHYTFAQLNQRCDIFAHGFQTAGIKANMRVILMVKPGLDFFALTFALFKLGAIPILIDPGMGIKKFMNCVHQSHPQAFIGIPLAQIIRRIFPKQFKSIQISLTIGGKHLFAKSSVENFTQTNTPFPVLPVSPQNQAAILFTTGSTGPAKGVVYTQQIFLTQIEILRREYNITPDDIDLPCFPLFALFSTALGVTAIIPDMDPSRPATVNPKRIIEAIQNQGVTYSFGSPTLWNRVSKYCKKNHITFPTLTRILMAGAPVPDYVHQRLLNHILPPNATTHVPYGATESLPIAGFTGKEMLAETASKTNQGAGMCVGYPMPEVTIKIIKITDQPIPQWQQAQILNIGEIGEIVVKGPIVTHKYHNLPKATTLAKIQDNKTIWHRMGDVGYIDQKGRIWFCGRKAHRVITPNQTLFTVQCEAIFNNHPKVYRSALVGIGKNKKQKTPVIIIEPTTNNYPNTKEQKNTLNKQLLKLAQKQQHTKNIKKILYHKSLPVDIRHNAKINREKLTKWANNKLN